VTLTAEKKRIQGFASKRRPNGLSNPRHKKEVKTRVTELHKTNQTCLIQILSPTKQDEFAEEVDSEGGASCITPPLE
jgi:hypothetical protein